MSLFGSSCLAGVEKLWTNRHRCTATNWGSFSPKNNFGPAVQSMSHFTDVCLFNLVRTLGYFINNNINVIFQQSSINMIWQQNNLCLYKQLSMHQSEFVEQCSQSTIYTILIGRYTLTDNRSDSQAGFWKDCSFWQCCG